MYIHAYQYFIVVYAYTWMGVPERSSLRLALQAL